MPALVEADSFPARGDHGVSAFADRRKIPGQAKSPAED
jgi:hypothetical protein